MTADAAKVSVTATVTNTGTAAGLDHLHLTAVRPLLLAGAARLAFFQKSPGRRCFPKPLWGNGIQVFLHGFLFHILPPYCENIVQYPSGIPKEYNIFPLFTVSKKICGRSKLYFGHCPS